MYVSPGGLSQGYHYAGRYKKLMYVSPGGLSQGCNHAGRYKKLMYVSPRGLSEWGLNESFKKLKNVSP